MGVAQRSPVQPVVFKQLHDPWKQTPPLRQGASSQLQAFPGGRQIPSHNWAQQAPVGSRRPDPKQTPKQSRSSAAQQIPLESTTAVPLQRPLQSLAGA